MSLLNEMGAMKKKAKRAHKEAKRQKARKDERDAMEAARSSEEQRLRALVAKLADKKGEAFPPKMSVKDRKRLRFVGIETSATRREAVAKWNAIVRKCQQGAEAAG